MLLSYRFASLRRASRSAGSSQKALPAAVYHFSTLRKEYLQDYASSINSREDFWRQAASAVFWYKPFDKVLDSSASPLFSWFTGGETNTSYNALDRHCENGAGESIALIYDSAVTETTKSFSYNDLREHVARFASALGSLGVGIGDRVIIYMPMIPEAVIAMLACARIGAIHSVVFGGFAAEELSTRINHAKPKVVLTASCGIEGPLKVIAYKPLLDKALALSAHQPSRCVVFQRSSGPRATLHPKRDVDWNTLLQQQSHLQTPVAVASQHPLYTLYTSGTTGDPKGVVRDTGGHMVSLLYACKHLFDIKAGDRWWAASDIGWVVGHSFIVYGPLLSGATTVLYEGKPVGTPGAGAFWRVVHQHRVKGLFCAPTAIRAMKKEDPEGKHISRYDLSKFRKLFLAGERADMDTLKWAAAHLKVPVIDNYWQTETGWPILCNNFSPDGETSVISPKLGTSGVAVPGYNCKIVDHDGSEVLAGKMGTLVVSLPLPPGCLSTLWQNDKRYIDSYLKKFPGHYLTGDAGFRDEDGYISVMARIDDVINVAGHRLSTGHLEEVIGLHPAIAESAVIGIADELKGELPLALVVLKNNTTLAPQTISNELIALVREKVGAVAALKHVLIVEKLPKTRSGKILRATLRNIAHGEPYKMPATIEDPEVLPKISALMTANKVIRARLV